MQNAMQVNDEQLKPGDIRQLENADEIAHFFAKLHYDVDERTPVPDYAALGLGSEDMRQHIHHIELIGKDPEDGDIVIYLFEVRSVTARLRNAIARRFRERPENALLILTHDYTELEFVLLERIVSKSKSRQQAFKQAIRPIPLTVNRFDVDSVALRVLKRFTFTEEDAAYQWEKLQSAYMLAEWSEEYFNNRALFSDYYLTERLTDPQITPAWEEDVTPIGREVFAHLSEARSTYTRQPEDVIRNKLFEPLFESLGFAFDEQKAASSSADVPDYLLYAPDDPDTPVAAALTYVWNRNLDNVDESRELSEDRGGTPFETPGTLVVSLLEAEVAPWVIVTNGKLWRLYSATTSNKATNYYEIDLEEAIAAGDQLTALKYWWLMFRREAFTGFLDELLQASNDYAKELGDRLKDRTFVEIFPAFAKGFLADMRAAYGIDEPTDEQLTTVFNATMTFLYRLMFTLYAESLELVPINDVRGYQEKSLYRIKQEIADAAGTVSDEVESGLAGYTADSYDLYNRLTELFTLIDEGSEDMNMPTYNGGLFSQTSDSGQFLATYHIPDLYLARGLDKLTRDIDTKTQALVFIDFKSLGVRQLGSIYEGLLEFRLKIADEPLAVTKSKGREVYKPAKKVKKPLDIIEEGMPYLENDKQERKATGSYYTPDYIVKYIVRHTVGPVLDERFEALRPRLHKAQKGYREYEDLVNARRASHGKDESPATYWTDPQFGMQQLVDDCLNIRVLDPAMGSGHFLVDVVDYISNRLIDFLNGWTENPVWAFLEQTRQDILSAMDKQHVTIDADRLTRVALLKRAVLKRCVYGVDLNLMAVELAKVSLWLDAFTLGAPLSFLDHHLKHGNSLIGSRVKEVQEALKGSGQLSMFSGSKFAGVMLATDLMRQVSYLSDNTIEQTRESAQAYQDARDHLAPYKRVLDVYTSRWFGNTPASDFDPTVEFLQRDDTQDWLQDPQQTDLPDDDYMQAGKVAQTALQAADAKNFFHWELEFPEIFFAPGTPGGQDVNLRDDGGFDAVVGNPPYVPTEQLLESDKKFFVSKFVLERKYETSVIFTQAGLHLLNLKGFVGYITPIVWQTGENYVSFRQEYLQRYQPIYIINLPFDVFPDAYIDTGIQIIGNPTTDELMNVLSYSEHEKLDDIDSEDDRWQQIPWLYIKQQDEFKVFTDLNQYLMRQKINNGNQFITLGEITDSCQGIVESFYEYKDSMQPDYTLEYRNLDAYRYRHSVAESKYINMTKEDSLYAYYTNPRILIRRIVNRSNRLMAMMESDSYVVKKDLNPFILKEDVSISIRYLLAILNSSFSSYLYTGGSTASLRDDFRQTTLAELNSLPVRKIDFSTPQAEREQLTQQLIGAYDLGDNRGVVQRVRDVLAEGQSDVVHDLLAHLAQRMIDLNQQKQDEINRFLNWLDGTLNIKPRKGKTGIPALKGYTIIQDYVGDYQKGEAHLPFVSQGNSDSFEYRIYYNKSRYHAAFSEVKGLIQTEYEQSLATLLPLKDELARTDALIDKIVYRLYGLTDEEIELIERPQYEQALTEAKQSVLDDKKIKDDEEAADKIAEGILPAAKRFFQRVEPQDIEATLNDELPDWQSLPPEAPVFLLTGDYNLRTQPDHMDFSTSVISYTKAVEVLLHEQVFAPFRQQATEADATNPFFKRFMRDEAHLTLGNYMFIIPSSKEAALHAFMGRVFSDVQAVITAFKDNQQRELRNNAAHDEVLSRDDAEIVREWAFGILRLV